MNRPSSLSVVVALSLLLVSGCLGGFGTPAETPEPTRQVDVSVSNDFETRYIVTVSVAPGPVDGFEVIYADGSTETFPEARGLEDLPQRAVAFAISVVPTGPGVTSERFDLEPGTGRGMTFEEVSRNATVFHVVANPALEEPMRTVGVDTCGASATFHRVEIDIRSSGTIDVSTFCEG